MKNKILITIAILMVVILLIIGVRYYFVIQNGYIAVFNTGRTGEISHEAYIYKIEDEKNYGFIYIKYVIGSSSWGSSDLVTKVEGIGRISSLDDLYNFAQKNNYSYVGIPNDSKEYTVKEFIQKLQQ